MSPDVVGERSAVASSSFKGIPVLGVRQDADTSAEADGDFSALRLNEEGRLKVATKPAAFTNTTQNITANGQTVPVDVSRASNITVHIKGGGTAGVGGNFIFEGSVDSTTGTDGTWFGIQAALTNANTVVTSTGVLGLAVNTGHTTAWEASANAYNWVRVRATAFTSGIYVVSVVRGAYATEPVPAIQTHGVSGNVAVTNALLATGAAGLGKAEDAVHASGDVGVMSLGVRNDNAATARSSANGDYDTVSVDANGAQFVRDRPAPTSVVTSVTPTTTSGTLLALNAARRGAALFNNTDRDVFVKLGSTATATTSFTVKLASGDYYEVPASYSGVIDGILASGPVGSGTVLVTEVS